MLDNFLDLDDLASATTFKGGGSRKAYPILVDAYFIEGLDPTKHHIIGRRADPAGNLATVKVFLDPEDPTAKNTDPNKRRPSILSFAFPDYAAAWAAARSSDEQTKNAAITTLTTLAQDTRAKTFTERGGIIIADGAQETEEGTIVARWIRPGRQNAEDVKHIIPAIDWATIRRHKSDKKADWFDVEALRTAESVLTTNIEELKAALLNVFFTANEFGNSAAYLRLLKTDNGTVTAMIPGGSAIGGGRIDLRDKKVGDKYIPRTPEEGLTEFLATPLAQKLAGPWGGANRIEVIPVTVASFGEKSLEKRKPPTWCHRRMAGQGRGLWAMRYPRFV